MIRDVNLTYVLTEVMYDHIVPSICNYKDMTLHFQLLDFVKKSILYAKITPFQKRFASKLSCKQTSCTPFICLNNNNNNNNKFLYSHILVRHQ